jgi:Domain of unknown function (DUF1904).
MPQIIIKGMELDKIKAISKPLVDELQLIVGCPRDYFTIEAVAGAFIMDGKQVEISPLVQVKWFDRGQEAQDKTAAVICRHIMSAGYSHVETFFTVLEESKYYENEIHY